MSWLTEIALKKSWRALLIAGLVIIGSIFAVLHLKMELIPNIEREILDMKGVKHVISTSASIYFPR
jgi:multidrug efflux pump subunit AcrB